MVLLPDGLVRVRSGLETAGDTDAKQVLEPDLFKERVDPDLDLLRAPPQAPESEPVSEESPMIWTPGTESVRTWEVQAPCLVDLG